jgi:TolA-binding protein
MINSRSNHFKGSILMKRIVAIPLILLISILVMVIGCQQKPSEEQLFTKAKTAQEARDFNAAVDAYKDVVANYPNGDKADEAQFMVGFLYANDLGDTLNARLAYEKFLNDYSSRSDEGMILSAKWELANLGKSIDEIDDVMDFTQDSE